MRGGESSANQRRDSPGTELLDALPVGVCVLDAGLAVVRANRLWSELQADLSAPVAALCERVLQSGEPAKLSGFASGERLWDLDAIPHGRGVLLAAVEVTQRAREAAGAQQVAAAAAERLTLAALDAQDAREREAQARAVAERRQEELDALFKSMAEPVVAFGRDGRVEATNRAAIAFFGDDVRGLAFFELARRYEIHRMNGEPAVPSDLPTARALRGEVVLGERLRVRCFRGERTILASAAPVRQHDAVHGVVLLITDVTDLDRTEAALREASRALQQANDRLQEVDRRKNDFLALLSHELRNPLAPIRNSVFIMAKAAPGAEQARRALAVIERQVTQMSRLIDDLLDLTRIERGKIRLQREPLALNEIVRGAAEDLRENFRRSGVDLRVCVPEEPLVADADRTRIAQVIGNLLHNAAKFTPRGGATELSLREGEDGQAVIEVRDTGAGIEPCVLDRLFEPFVQADATIERSRGGLGLGLALVKGLVELHGGEVSASSEGLGKGATFRVALPLAHPEHEAEAGGASEAAAARGLRVLIVEDNLDAATSLKEVLELSGHSVEVAYNGAEGIEKARASPPDVVLCDIGLPGVDGYGVARALRSDPRLSSTYLVALTGYALPEDVERARQAGFDQHMAKPMSLESLETLLAAAGP